MSNKNFYICLYLLLVFSCNIENRVEEKSKNQNTTSQTCIEYNFISNSTTLKKFINEIDDLYLPITLIDSVANDTLKNIFLYKELGWLLLVKKEGSILNRVPLVKYKPNALEEVKQRFISEFKPPLGSSVFRHEAALLDNSTRKYKIIHSITEHVELSELGVPSTMKEERMFIISLMEGTISYTSNYNNSIYSWPY